MSNRWYVVETEIIGRRDACFTANDQAPWRHLPRHYAGMAGAADRIAAAGYPVLFPLKRTLEIDRRSGKPVVVDRPAYAGYLLASFDVGSYRAWSAVKEARGVRGVLSLGSDRPIPVLDRVVDKLMGEDIARSTLTLDAMLQRQRRKPFQVGATVTLDSKALGTVEALVKHDDGGADVRLEVAGWLDVTAPAISIKAA